MKTNYKYVHHNKCDGGHAIEEVDGNVYCYGRQDSMYDEMGVDEYDTYDEMCKACPRFYYNNVEKIDSWIQNNRSNKFEITGQTNDVFHRYIDSDFGTPCDEFTSSTTNGDNTIESHLATKEEIDELARYIVEKGNITLKDIYLGEIEAKISAWYWKIKLWLKEHIHE